MILRGKWSCLWTLGLCLVASEPSQNIPSITDQKFIEQCVDRHNEVRSKVSPPAADMRYMTWEASLAKVAKSWADHCTFQHNTCTSTPFACHPNYQFIGENIWLGTVHIFSPKMAIHSWYNETQFYNFETQTCTSVCGHYTQVVWATSRKVGCAITLCPNLGNDTAIFVCNYAPAGNFPMSPYTKGTSCSMCEEKDSCVKNLCKNKDDENTLSDINWNPEGTGVQSMAPQWIACNVLCLVYTLLSIF